MQPKGQRSHGEVKESDFWRKFIVY